LTSVEKLIGAGPLSNRYSLHLVERYFLGAAVVEAYEAVMGANCVMDVSQPL
jgi:hypothetical protein